VPGQPAGRAGSGDAPPPPPPPPEKKSELSEPIHETVRVSLSIEIFQTTPFRKSKGFLKRCAYVKAKKHLLNFPSLGGRVPETEEIWRWKSCYVDVDVAVLRIQNSGRYHLLAYLRMKFGKKYSCVYSYILVYSVIYHVQTCIYSAKPRYTELSQSIEIITSHTWIYLDILVYSEIYINRIGIYSDIRGITQYI